MRIVDKDNYNEYIQSDRDTFNESWKQRDFVSDVKDYVQSSVRKVLIVSGLRGTGKTTGIIQVLKDVDGVYVCAEKSNDVDAKGYKEFILSRPEKVIMLDEYTWIKNRREYELDELLDNLVNHGKRVIITGTESLSLEALKSGPLIHRAITIHTTFLSFNEYCRLNDMPMSLETCDLYLKQGGVFEEYATSNFSTMASYIQNAIIDNLKAYIVEIMPGFDMAKISNIVYSIFYKSIKDIMDTKIPVRDNSIKSLDNLTRLGIEIEDTLAPFDVAQVSNILEQAGVIVKIPNLVPRKEKAASFGLSKDERTYIVNPSLTWQLLCSIYDEKVLGNDLLGFVYESTCMVDMYHHKLADDKIYFLENNQDGRNYELDFVITQSEGSGHQISYLFECKHAAVINLNTEKGKKWTIANGIAEHIINEIFPEGEIGGKYIIHPGECSLQNVNESEVLVIDQGEYLRNYYNFEDNKRKIASGLVESRLPKLNKRR
ncbi:AAA family ATPase [Acetivibrio ethanolgignens]|uniref:Uncharacterized protein n=1 Tax=Acetivibrio ethanolgignens TaxID=290052 RepID=A0A0V8QFE1_9FIRM|nr:AAA family ATPase [Acetivibrio ethanolgignens]KSV59268.1 hypothetical protein ASU35_09720 [Acetivibrio ethanolgignens]